MSVPHLHVSESLLLFTSGQIEVKLQAVKPVTVVEGILWLRRREDALVLVHAGLTKILRARSPKGPKVQLIVAIETARIHEYDFSRLLVRADISSPYISVNEARLYRIRPTLQRI